MAGKKDRGKGAMKKKDIITLIIYAVIFLLLFILGIAGVLSSNAMRYLLQIFLYIVLGEMWNLLSGFTGMTSLGQQTFIGLAGYSVAMITSVYRLPYSLGILAGVIISSAVAFILAFLLLRMHGMYFAIATWVVAEALGTFFLSWKYVNQGAGMTVTIVPYPRVEKLYMIALVLAALAIAVMYLLLRTRLGLGLTAMRDDIEAAASLGVNISRLKLIVYLVAAVFTALAGAVFFINKGTIYPESGFDIGWTISMVFIVIIGGVGTIEGPLVGSVIYVLLSEQLAHYPGWSNIILGVIAILVILFMPEGIVGFLKRGKHIEKAVHS